MPIAIAGAGTVTGVSVGGLPDGIVDTDMIAAAAVTDVKRGPGAILQIAQTTATGDVSSSSASSIIASGHICSVTPKQTGSKFLVTADGISGHFNRVSTTNFGCRYFIYASVNSGTYANVTSALLQNVYVNGDTGAWLNPPVGFSFLAAPSYSAGQTVAFQTYFQRGNGDSSSVTFYYNHGSSGGQNVRTLTVMEVSQ